MKRETDSKSSATAPVPVTHSPPELAAKKLIPVTKWNEHHAWPPLGGLRHLVFHEKTNGFDSVVRRVGRRVLIEESAFFEWVEQQNQSIP